MKKLHKSLLYIAYTLVATGCFLYLLFPSQTFKGVVSTYLLKMLPGYQIQFDRAAAGFTLGARVRVGKRFTKRTHVGPNRQTECNTPDCIAIVTPKNDQLSRQGLSGSPEGAYGCKHV